jgi:hypothetical protein
LGARGPGKPKESVTLTNSQSERARTPAGGSAHEICPYLGLGYDPNSFWPEPSEGNVCYALGAPTHVGFPEQRMLCLSGSYPRCPRFLSSTPARPAALRRPERKPFWERVSPTGVMIVGVIALVMLFACSIGLVLYQSSALRRQAAAVQLPTLEPPTETPADTDTPAPTATTPATHTATATTAPTMPPTMTLTPTVLRPAAPTISSPTPAPTQRIVIPTATQPRYVVPTVPVYRTPTPYITNTPRPTYTPWPTLTPTFTLTPTPLPYAISLSAGQTSLEIQPGQTASFDLTLTNLAVVADTVTVQLYPAILPGWTAKLFVDGADHGAGPASIALAASTAKTITVKIGAPATAAPGDASQVIVSATSQGSAAISASQSLTASIAKATTH